MKSTKNRGIAITLGILIVAAVFLLAVSPAIESRAGTSGSAWLEPSSRAISLSDFDPDTGTWTDPKADAYRLSDLVGGSAYLYGNQAEFRAGFAPPLFLPIFPTTEIDYRQSLTWCLDTDRNPATGSACGIAGADRWFTLNAHFNPVLRTWEYSFDGALRTLNPCSVGSISFTNEEIRLRVPLRMLTYGDRFDYTLVTALQETEGDSSNLHTDQAPDLPDFSSPGGSFSAVNQAPPAFSGGPLCSPRVVQLRARKTGTVTQYPEEYGPPHYAWDGYVQPMYVQNSPTLDRQFGRGFFEFVVPPPPAGTHVYKATLILAGFDTIDDLELAGYQPADLAITQDDYDRPAVELPDLTPVGTDQSGQRTLYAADVTQFWRSLEQDSLGFRLKLAADPDYAELGALLSPFSGYNEVYDDRIPRIELVRCHAWSPIGPGHPAFLSVDEFATDTLDLTTQVFVPADAVGETTNLLFNRVTTIEPLSDIPLRTSSDSESSDQVYVIQPFLLDAYQDGSPVDGLSFQPPITVTAYYTDTTAGGDLVGDSLELSYWDGDGWVDAACGPVERDALLGRVAVPVCRSGEFAWSVPIRSATPQPTPQPTATPQPGTNPLRIYLPLVTRGDR